MALIRAKHGKNLGGVLKVSDLLCILYRTGYDVYRVLALNLSKNVFRMITRSLLFHSAQMCPTGKATVALTN